MVCVSARIYAIICLPCLRRGPDKSTVVEGYKERSERGGKTCGLSREHDRDRITKTGNQISEIYSNE